MFSRQGAGFKPVPTDESMPGNVLEGQETVKTPGTR